MRFPAIFSVALFAFGAALSVPAMAADDCAPLQMISSVDLIMGNNGPTVPVTINAKPSTMLISTSAGITSFNPGAVDGLGLHAIDAARVRMLSGSGKASSSYVGVGNLSIGAVQVRNGEFMVLPDDLGTGTAMAGLLGGDILSRYDVEMDFAAGKLNFFSQKHCPGRVIYWHPAALAVVPISLRAPTPDGSRTGFVSYVDRDAQVWVPVTLDGKPFQALISTTGRSSMNEGTAKFLLGVTADSPGSTPLPGSDPERKAFDHIFSTLVFDGVTVTRPRFAVLADVVGSKDPDNSSRTDSRVHHVDDGFGPQIVIGMDVLRKLHLFVSFGERKLYITEASAASRIPDMTALPAEHPTSTTQR